MGGVGTQETLILLLVFFVLVICFWGVFGKAGYPGWYGIGMLLPVANIALVLFLAFSEWPVERLLRQSQQGGNGGRGRV